MNNNANDERIIFHIDVNSAFLSWTAVKLLEEGEELDIRTVPSIIGGDSDKRHGIVLAKSIPAKKFGIETAEPIVNALRKCPELIIKASDFNTYKKNSLALMEHLSSFCPDIEQVSIDECYMDFTPIRHNYSSPIEAANIIKNSVKELLGFTVNIGISDRKVLAKMASDFEKPDKVHTLFSYEIKEKMWPLPTKDLYMCGKSSQQQLFKLGIRTIGDLAKYDLSILTSNLKSHGKMLHNFANGIDDSKVELSHEPVKGVGNSTTLDHDLLSREEALSTLLFLSSKVASRLREQKKKALMVTVEIKYSDFTSASHQMPLERASNSQSTIYKTACSLFDNLWNNKPIRLLGIRTAKLADETDPYQMNIIDFLAEKDLFIQDDSISNNDTNQEIQKKIVDRQKENKEEILDAALDKMRNKYGASSITKGTLVKKTQE